MTPHTALPVRDDTSRNFFTFFITPIFVAIFLCVLVFVLLHHEHRKTLSEQSEQTLLSWLLTNTPEPFALSSAESWLQDHAGPLVDEGLFAGFAIEFDGAIIARYGYTPPPLKLQAQPEEENNTNAGFNVFDLLKIKKNSGEKVKPHHQTSRYPLIFQGNKAANLKVYSDYSHHRISLLNTLLWGFGLTMMLGVFVIWLGICAKKRLIAPIKNLQAALQHSVERNYETDLPTSNSPFLAGVFEYCQYIIDANRALTQSSQHYVEDSLSELRESLETVEVQNIELDMARKQALETAEKKSELLATTSHEIRTPLNGIVGFTRLLFDTSLSEQQRDYLLTIEQSAHGLLTVINDIIDYAKLESAPVNLEFKPVVLYDIVYEALQTLAPAANENQLRLIQHIDPRIPSLLLGDPLRLKQVLNHLCLYLLRQNAKGNLVVGIMLKQVENSRCSLVFSIACTNISVGQKKFAVLRKILAEPKADPSSATEVLGISVAQTIAERMGDKISAFDDNGLEFRWSVTLGSQQSDTPEFTQFDSGTLRVLIHESDADATREIILDLQSFDISPRVEKNIDNLHDIARDKQAQLVILDCATLGQSFNKSDAVKSISQLAHIRNLHIAVIAPSPIRRQLEQQISGEYIHYLTRPVKRGSFRAVLRAAMGSPIELLKNSASQKPVNVMVADDNPANSKLVATLLAKENHQVVIANDGNEAVSLYQSRQPDIIFMDIQMPKMDGLEATQTIRSLEQAGERIPIIALTANASHDQRQKILIAGMDDFLTKPVSAEDLTHTLRRWVTDNQSGLLPIDTITQKLQNPEKVGLQPAEQPHNQEQEASGLASLELGTSHKPSEASLVSPRVFSLRENLRMSNGDAVLAQDMLQMLLKEIPEHKQSIKDALNRNDIQHAAESVHRLRGGAAYTGCVALGEAAAAAEDLLIQADQGENIEEALHTQASRSLQALLSEIDDVQAFERQTDITALYA